MEFEAPAPQTTTKATELKLNQPKPFTGKRNEIDNFLQDVALYLEINDEIYNTDKKKIRYTLTFMNKGDAKSWKAQFLRNAIADTGLDLGTWRDFVTKVQDAFAPYDAPGDALEEITNLKMGTPQLMITSHDTRSFLTDPEYPGIPLLQSTTSEGH